jgi:hypothetical protein
VIVVAHATISYSIQFLYEIEWSAMPNRAGETTVEALWPKL